MIAIVDYGLGNIKAFSNIYKRLDVPHFFASDAEGLSKASKIILPGVGAFDYAMEKLNASGLRSTLDSLVLEKKVPVLGICVGMQMMGNSSEEGQLPGLGWIPGTVKRLHGSGGAEFKSYPLPHMGWNNLKTEVSDPLFEGFDHDPKFYFLHSYFFDCKDSSHIIASAEYGQRFACIIRRDNIYGVQCHPEKSHHNGVALLKSFAGI
ncbi:imidazole glycerol phosphate synthase subunit HisH [Bdellovibrio bacteriovorus]|uniref:imidazole glycerol phosphate synthase subunit HisH n=1 Tax=Bdellovibrio bacteriovorus TaxID=959 RepID=UPI003A7F7314